MALTPTTVAPSVGSDEGTPDEASEGIKVHGHWTIEVRNPDDSVDLRVEFDNALVANAGDQLPWILGGMRAFSGVWQVGVIDYDGAAVCTSIGGICWENARVAVVPEGLRLSAAQTAVQDGEFEEVWTRYESCWGVDISAVDCGSSPNRDWTLFTRKSLAEIPGGPSVIAVRQNQTVYLEVLVSFS